jgi:hypothetical protein
MFSKKLNTRLVRVSRLVVSKIGSSNVLSPVIEWLTRGPDSTARPTC